jgi:lipopolysaccharide transport system ATP-binding protein
MASLLEVGTGFHPELTGRENIFLNAAILGMRRSDIARRFDEIVAFSEVEQFLDTPVKRYSSGMLVRLAFGVAAHLDPDILLVDEVLAVGDAAFQQKCLGKMGSVVQDGRTVLFVSHNMAAVSALCSRALLIGGGRLMQSGTTNEIVDQYIANARTQASTHLATRVDRKGDGRVRFVSARIQNDRGEAVESAMTGQDISLCLEYDIPAAATLRNVVVQASFLGSVGQPLFVCSSRISSKEDLPLQPGGALVCRIPALPLLPGVYTYTLSCRVGGEVADFVPDASKLTVVGGDFFGTGKLPARETGEFLVPHAWSVE